MAAAKSGSTEFSEFTRKQILHYQKMFKQLSRLACILYVAYEALEMSRYSISLFDIRYSVNTVLTAVCRLLYIVVSIKEDKMGPIYISSVVITCEIKLF